MVEQTGDQQSNTTESPPVARGKLRYFAKGVALAGVIAITVTLTLWVSRDAERTGVEILIPALAPVTFQVSGEVIRPGVYSLDGEPRIDDAIDAAGGFTPDANADLMNLALHVRDGAKVIVPSLLGSELGSQTNGADNVDSGGDSAGPSVTVDNTVNPALNAITGPIDLNTATKEQLIAMPGIGEIRANSIIEWWANNFINSVDDLQAISGIGQSTVDSIRDHVIQP
ncbi:MAG: helix-hairpin-helix domain-containing protein [Chloroflexi bacterium]|nr:helix-hairpin-helix domain-containing protein [Chloroflexota bacterium]